jgi:membrane-bound ClpP family serine protease
MKYSRGLIEAFMVLALVLGIIGIGYVITGLFINHHLGFAELFSKYFIEIMFSVNSILAYLLGRILLEKDNGLPKD